MIQMAVACPRTQAVAGPKQTGERTGEWYVLKVKAHKEAYVQMQLEACAGIATYCPYMKTAKRYLHKGQRRIEPVFPGYVFVRLNALADRLHIRRLNGHDTLICFDGHPATISPAFIGEFRSRETREGFIPYRPARKLRANDPVRITDGPFRGQTGAFLNYRDSTQRVCLLLEFMNSRTVVQLPTGSVEAVNC